MGRRVPEFTLLNHTADLGIQVRGSDVKNLFENAAKVLVHLMVKGESLKETLPRKISVSGEDLADLMVQWLGEILYLFEGEKEVVTSLHIESLMPSALKASVNTVPFDPEIHEILSEIKAVTYHQIDVAPKRDYWEAKVIFDI
jgi:SHS2 domain-containing protein